MASGFRDFGHIFDGNWKAVGTENYLKDNVYEPAGAWAGKEVDIALGGDGSQGEKYGEMVGSGMYYYADIKTGIKGTVKALQTLKKAQWTRGTFQATKTTIQMEELVGYQTNKALIMNISKDSVGYYYNVKSAIEEFTHDLFQKRIREILK